MQGTPAYAAEGPPECDEDDGGDEDPYAPEAYMSVSAEENEISDQGRRPSGRRRCTSSSNCFSWRSASLAFFSAMERVLCPFLPFPATIGLQSYKHRDAV